jgi:ornithine cyclodeaminase
MLILTRAQVESLLDVDALIDAVGVAMSELSAGRAQAPPRIAVPVPERDGIVAAMPGSVPVAGALTTKLVSMFPRNAGTELPTHQALIIAFHPGTGQPTALLDGELITAARTAAGAALSARLLARADASELAVLGTGVQARAHIDAVRRVRPIRRVRVAGRDRAKAAALAAEFDGVDGLEVVAADGFEAAVTGADIVSVATHAGQPVLRRAWLAPGAHVTSVGFNPAGGEVDDETLLDALLCVETRAIALTPFPVGPPDLTRLIASGRLGAEDIHAELGELVDGSRPGRSSADQLTLYRSVGVAVQDAAAATLVLDAARRDGVGREVEL